MKVKCIDNKFVEENLTLNKSYSVIKQTKKFYKMTDDTNKELYYLKNRFVPAEGSSDAAEEIGESDKERVKQKINAKMKEQEIIREFIREQYKMNKISIDTYRSQINDVNATINTLKWVLSIMD